MLLQRKQPLSARPSNRRWATALLVALAALIPTIVCVGVRPLAAKDAGKDDKQQALCQELLRQVRRTIKDLESQGKDVPEALRKLADKLAKPIASNDLDKAAVEHDQLVYKQKDVSTKDAHTLDAMRRRLLTKVHIVIADLKSQGMDVPKALRKLAARLEKRMTAEELDAAVAEYKSLVPNPMVLAAKDVEKLDAMRTKLRKAIYRDMENLKSQGKGVSEALGRLADRLEKPMTADGLEKAEAEYKAILQKLQGVPADESDKVDAERKKLLQSVERAIEELKSNAREVPDALRKLADRLEKPMTLKELEKATAEYKAVLQKLENLRKKELQELDEMRKKLLKSVQNSIKELKSEGRKVPDALRKLADRLEKPIALDELEKAAAEYKALVQKLENLRKKELQELDEMRKKLLRSVQNSIKELKSQGRDVPEALRKLADRLEKPMTLKELEKATAEYKTLLQKIEDLSK